MTQRKSTEAEKFVSEVTSANVWQMLEGKEFETLCEQSSDSSLRVYFSDGSTAYIGNPDEMVYEFFAYAEQA